MKVADGSARWIHEINCFFRSRLTIVKLASRSRSNLTRVVLGPWVSNDMTFTPRVARARERLPSPAKSSAKHL